MSNQSRVSRGVPTGGQFATTAKGEATGVTLTQPQPGNGARVPLRTLLKQDIKDAAARGAAAGDRDADRVMAAGSRAVAKVNGLFRRRRA